MSPRVSTPVLLSEAEVMPATPSVPLVKRAAPMKRPWAVSDHGPSWYVAASTARSLGMPLA